jgi:hypothetical protein
MKLYEFIQPYPSQIYMSMTRLMFEHIIVFMNGSFIIWTETDSSLTEPSQFEFTNDWTHLKSLDKHNQTPR